MKLSLVERVKEIGLTDKEARVYLSILELGEATATEISKRSEIQRTTTYNIIPILQKKGLVDSSQKNGVKYFFVSKIDSLVQVHERALSDTKALVSELKSIKKVIPQKSRVTVYEGITGLRKIYEDIVENSMSGQEILAYVGSSDFLEYIPQKLVTEFLQKRINKKLPLRLISDNSSFVKNVSESDKNSLRKIKFLKSKHEPFHGETIIYSNKVAMISYAEGFLGTIIESEEIYNMQKSIFIDLWENIN
jgi:sugar-specific transcriptional regulator TrmB